MHIHGKGLAWAAIFCAALGSAACAGSQEPKAARGEQLPVFTPEEASLFDDAFSPAVLSSEIQFEADDKLYLRVRRAEAVIPAVVATVTEDRGSNGEHVFSVSLRPTGPPFAGQEWREMVIVEVGPVSPSYSLLQTVGRSLVGTPVILFFRRYKDDGQTVVHWRAEPARDDARQAIERARALGQAGK